MEKKARKKRKHVVLKLFLWTLLVLALSAGVFLMYVISKAPDIDKIDATPKGYRSSVIDTEGNIVLALSGEESNRVYVKLDEVPEDLKNAVVAIEDERFYKHHGVDIRGIFRALYRGIRDRNFSEGASTITQQLLKNNVFTDWMGEDTFYDRLERKIQEQYLAVRLEMRYDKDWILENYLNTINLGGGNWGVETAARYYFHRDVSELTLSECACLAAITKNPTTYNPYRNPEENAGRRILVLDKMLELGMISQEEYDEAAADDVYTRIREAHTPGANQEVMTWFEDELVYQLVDDLVAQTGCSEEEAWNRLYRGGLTIFSTEDSRLQAICEEQAAREDLFPDGSQISLVVIDTENGAVRAMVGGRGEKDASLLYNRATSSVRQPGSTVKVIGQYAAGLEDGRLTLGTAVDDAPHTWFDGTDIHNSDGVYAGMTTIHQAIIKSDNVIAAKCLQEFGVDRTFASIESFGITTLTDDDKVEALALGGTANGVTNLEMTAAYATIARGGEYVEPYYYTRVVDREGRPVLEKRPEIHRAVDEETADLLTIALSDVITRGTGTDCRFEGMSLAGKSGTTTGAKDAWFIGYSPYLTCGSWGGYDDYREQADPGYVKILWREVMSRAHEGLTDPGFSDTEGLVQVSICTKCGNRAVPGLCDSTVEGDVTMEEWYVNGTQPTRPCTCHEKVEICTESGDRAGRYCPKDCIETRVYLASATEGTLDADYVTPEQYKSGTCHTHTWFWSAWFNHPDDSSGGNAEEHGGTGGDSGDSGSNFWNNGDLDGGDDPSGGSGGQDDGPDDPGDPGSQDGGQDGGSGPDADGSGQDDSSGGDESDGGWHWPWENWFGGNSGNDGSGGGNAEEHGGTGGQDGGDQSGGDDSSEESSPGFWDWLFGR